MDMLKAGAARKDITPGEEFIKLPGEESGKLELAGYGFVGRKYPDRRWMEGVHDPLYSTAMVLDNGEKSIAIVSNDLISLPEEEVAKIRKRVKVYTQIPEEDIMVTCTHVHHGPATTDRGLRACGDMNPEYMERLHEVIADSVINAYSMSRRNTIEDIRFGRGRPDKKVSYNREGRKLDDDMVTVFGDISGHSNLFTLLNFACHPVVMERDNRLVTRDFIGAITDYLERAGYRNILWTNGACGDIDPIINETRKPKGVRYTLPPSDFKDLDFYGETLGDNVIELDLSSSNSREPGITSISRRVRLPLDIARRYPEQHQYDSIRQAPGSPFRNDFLEDLKKFIESVETGEKSFPEYIEGEIQAIKIGPNTFIGIPAEVMSETGLAIKERHPGAVIVGYANGREWGYIPPKKAADEPGYSIHGYKIYGLFPFSPEAGPELIYQVGSLLKEIDKKAKHSQPI